MSDLKPCRWCGSIAVSVEWDEIYCPVEYSAAVRCLRCDALSPSSKFNYDNVDEAHDDAVKQHNTRPAPVPRVKPLEWVGVGGQVYASAFGIDRAYLITRRSEGQVDVRYVGNRREEIKEGFKSQPEAKSWVFDHYERRILSALDMEKDDD